MTVCGALTNPANGRVTYIDGPGFGQTAAYSCNAGYNLVGSSIRTCQLVGWFESEPTCQRMLQLCTVVCVSANSVSSLVLCICIVYISTEPPVCP